MTQEIKVIYLDMTERETLEKLLHAERERITLERENAVDGSTNVEDSTVTHFPDVDMSFDEWETRILMLEDLVNE